MAASKTLVTVYPERLYQLGHGPSGGVYVYILRLATKVDTRAKMYLSNDLVKVRTGNLRSSQAPPIVTSEAAGAVRAIIQNTASYALVVHEGSRPHQIVPRSKKVLTGWVYDGAPVFTPRVNHPGTTGRPWLRRALTDVMATA